MASQAEKEKARRAEVERAYVAEADPVPWRDALVADRPSVTVTRIVDAALDAGWTVREKYRETFLPPQWVAVDGEAHRYEARLARVYSLLVAHSDSPERPRGTDHELLAVQAHWIDSVAKSVKLGWADYLLWTPGPSTSSIARLIREARA